MSRGANLKARHVWIYSVRWANPYREPSDGMPRELVNQVQPTNGIPNGFLELAARHPGYGLYCDVWSSREGRRRAPLTARRYSIDHSELQRRS